MTTIERRYLQYYTPLVQEFVKDIESLPHINIKGMPEPHFPLFGKNYEKSALKLVVVGQDTAGWWDLFEFITAEKNSPGSKLMQHLKEFQEHNFTRWGDRRQTFWGFTMMMVAALHN